MAAVDTTAEAPPDTPDAPAAPVAASAEPREPQKHDELDADAPSVAAHPRAARAVARAKGWGGLAGFVVGGYLSLPTNTLAGAGLRALVAGIVCYVAAWAGAVFLWRRLVILEIKSREQKLVEAVKAANARRELPPGSERPAAGAAS
ncbi:MAG TPA: hypothetical protein VK790_03235 [Solirubrobacteraceae bacterium]|jgi:hypothetical protein|nr:hypothetical protein [Solirubrobacteraceae bacterium]